MPALTKPASLYNGTINLVFYPDSHRYRIEGEKTYLISATACTGVLNKPALIPWALNLAGNFIKEYMVKNGQATALELNAVIDEALKQHTIKKTDAADIGSLVHAFAQSFAESKLHGTPTPEIPTDGDPKMIAGINAFLDWYIKHDVQFIQVEQIVYSKQHGYCGIFDAVAMVNGKKVIIDYKTSKRVYNDHRYQIAGYRGAYEEENGKIDGAIVLHFDKETGEFDMVELTDEDHAADYPVFLACYEIKKRDKELTKLNGYVAE